MAAAVLPKEEIVKEINEACTEFLSSKSEESEQLLKAYCMLLLTKEATGDSIEEAFKFSQKVERVEKAEELLNPSEN